MTPRSSTLIACRPGASVPCPVRCAQDVAAPARTRPRRGPVHRGAADGQQGWTGALRGQAVAHHDPGRSATRGRLIWSTGTSPPPARTSCGSRTSPTSRPGPARSTSRSSSTCSPAGSWAGGPPPRMTTELVLDCLEHAIWTRAATASATCPGWCTTPTPAASTPRSRSPSGSSTSASTPRSARWATPTTTPWPSPRSGSTRPS